MNGQITIETHPGYVHYYIDNNYLGMFIFPKGEISDFRAVIRKNNIHTTEENLYEQLRFCLFELLTHYLTEHAFLHAEALQTKKTEIVKENEQYLKQISETIKEQKGLTYAA